MTGHRLSWPPPQPTISLHLLKPLLSIPSRLLPDPKPFLFPNLIQSLLSFLPSSKLKPIVSEAQAHREPPPPRRLGSQGGCAVPLFRPYVATIPWHGGARAFLSQLFPRYGHYCGPNWSSGKDGGSMLWDKRPIDWLDFCCYCHDIGYDTHDQAKLLKADLAFLECLERPRMATKGGAHLALLYRSMCIAGLRHVLIPYRMQLIRMQNAPSFVDVLSSLMSLRRGNAYRQNSG